MRVQEHLPCLQPLSPHRYNLIITLIKPCLSDLTSWCKGAARRMGRPCIPWLVQVAVEAQLLQGHSRDNQAEEGSVLYRNLPSAAAACKKRENRSSDAEK